MTDQVDANYRWFEALRGTLVGSHGGQHALLHDQTIAGFYQTSLDAVIAGMARYGEGRFSVESVDAVVEDLGFYSHVGATLRA